MLSVLMTEPDLPWLMSLTSLVGLTLNPRVVADSPYHYTFLSPLLIGCPLAERSKQDIVVISLDPCGMGGTDDAKMV